MKLKPDLWLAPAHPLVIGNAADLETAVGTGRVRKDTRNRAAIDLPLRHRSAGNRPAGRVDNRASERGLFAQKLDLDIVGFAVATRPDTVDSNRSIVGFGKDQVEERIDQIIRARRGETRKLKTPLPGR